MNSGQLLGGLKFSIAVSNENTATEVHMTKKCSSVAIERQIKIRELL